MNVLFENEACIVINKGIGEDCETLFHREPLAGVSPDLKLIHRLDTPASGCLLLAKTKEAAAFLSAAFARSGSMHPEKRYWAITELPKDQALLPSPDNAGVWLEAVHWLRFSPAKNKSFTYSEERPKSKKAALRCRIIGRGERYLFWEIDLITGRHHQIRCQLAALGFPVKGDLKYGARRSEKAGGIRLHAGSLSFPDPLNAARTIAVHAPPPGKGLVGAQNPRVSIGPRESSDPLWEAFTAALAAFRQ